MSKNVDPSIKTRIIGDYIQFNRMFKYYFGIELALLEQNLIVTASEGQKFASKTIATLFQCRSDNVC